MENVGKPLVFSNKKIENFFRNFHVAYDMLPIIVFDLLSQYCFKVELPVFSFLHK